MALKTSARATSSKGFLKMTKRAIAQPVFAPVIGRSQEHNHRVHIRPGKGAFHLVVQHQLDVAVPEQELLQLGAVAHIEPGVGGDKAEAPLRVEEREGVEVEVDVEVAFAIGLAEGV
jgi:hypothetical protein